MAELLAICFGTGSDYQWQYWLCVCVQREWGTDRLVWQRRVGYKPKNREVKVLRLVRTEGVVMLKIEEQFW